MKNPSTRLLICSTLFTLGVVLMLLGIFWLMLLGLALMALAALLPLQHQPAGGWMLAGFLIFVVNAITSLFLGLHHGDAFIQEARPFWFWVLMGGTWLLVVIGELQQWRRSRRST